MVIKFARKFMFLAKIPLDATAFSVRIVSMYKARVESDRHLNENDVMLVIT